MKLTNILLGLLILYFVYMLVQQYREGFKNVDSDAALRLEKIKTRILPSGSLCIRGAQCISGVCLENNNETTYGFCK